MPWGCAYRWYIEDMVRPESCTDLAGASPVQVIAREPGSRPQWSGEIQAAERGVKSHIRLEQVHGPQYEVNVAASSDYQPKGASEGRAAHFTAKATDSILVLERVLALCGVWTAARGQRSVRNRRGPTRRQLSRQSEAYKGQTEVASGREGVRGPHMSG